MKVITAPEIYVPLSGDITCFLAGGISNCADWQQEVITWLEEAEEKGIDLSHLVLFNPRRKDYIDKPSIAEEQIEWEFNKLEISDIFSMYFCNSESVQPICMYELGRNILKMQNEYPDDYFNHIVLSVEKGYKRSLDVAMQTFLALGENRVINNGIPSIHAAAILLAYSYLTNN